MLTIIISSRGVKLSFFSLNLPSYAVYFVELITNHRDRVITPATRLLYSTAATSDVLSDPYYQNINFY